MLGDEAGAFMAAYGVTLIDNFEAWEKRVRPDHEEEVLTSRSGLMLAAFAEAIRMLDRDDYQEVAECNADVLLPDLQLDDGRLLDS